MSPRKERRRRRIPHPIIPEMMLMFVTMPADLVYVATPIRMKEIAYTWREESRAKRRG